MFLHPQHLNLKKTHGAEATLVLLRSVSPSVQSLPSAPPVAGLCEGLQPERQAKCPQYCVPLSAKLTITDPLENSSENGCGSHPSESFISTETLPMFQKPRCCLTGGCIAPSATSGS